MTVKIIRKDEQGVTDEMLLAALRSINSLSGEFEEISVECMRQAMEAARKGEIEIIQVDQKKVSDFRVFVNDDGSIFIHGCGDYTQICVEKENLRPLAQALLELADQVEEKSCGTI